MYKEKIEIEQRAISRVGPEIQSLMKCRKRIAGSPLEGDQIKKDTFATVKSDNTPGLTFSQHSAFCEIIFLTSYTVLG